MRWFILLFLSCTLCSCGSVSASHDIADSAINATTAIEKSLPADCATDAIKTQIQAVKTQITAITKACETEKAEIRADKVKWQTAFWGLFVVVAAFVLKKVLK